MPELLALYTVFVSKEENVFVKTKSQQTEFVGDDIKIVGKFFNIHKTPPYVHYFLQSYSNKCAII